MLKFELAIRPFLVLIANDGPSFIVEVILVATAFKLLDFLPPQLLFKVQPIIFHILLAFEHTYHRPLEQTLF